MCEDGSSIRYGRQDINCVRTRFLPSLPLASLAAEEGGSALPLAEAITYTMIPMNDTTPSLHPMEREQLIAESTLVVTVKPTSDFHDDVTDGIESLERGAGVDATPMLSFTSYDELMETLTPRVLSLIESIRREQPASINHTARVVDRDVKNVYQELNQLARLGIIFFEKEGQKKRPVVWFDELTINLPFDPEAGDTATATP